MITLDDIIFIDNLPTIDLHGMDRDLARITIQDFIKENIIQKNQFIVIIHGIGAGILKKETHQVLKGHRQVSTYKTFYYNDGATIVQLSI